MPVYPSQSRSIDPFIGNRWSDSINRFTRIVSGGENVLLPYPTANFSLSMVDSTSINIGPGMVIKDDAFIHINQNTVLDFTVETNYEPTTNSALSPDGYMMFALHYTYARSIPFPKATYCIIKNPNTFLNNESLYLFLGTVLISGGAITSVLDTYPGYEATIYRKYPTILIPSVDGGWID